MLGGDYLKRGSESLHREMICQKRWGGAKKVNIGNFRRNVGRAMYRKESCDPDCSPQNLVKARSKKQSKERLLNANPR